MSLSSLVSKIKHSIEKGEFDEHLCLQIDASCKNNPDCQTLLVKLNRTNIDATITNDTQRYALLKYLRRILFILGHENMSIWYDFIIGNLSSQDKKIAEALNELLLDLMVRDNNVRDLVFVKYFASKGPTELKILLDFKQIAPKDFFIKIDDFLRSKDEDILYTSVDLLSNAISKKGAGTHEIAETPTLKRLIRILSTSNDFNILTSVLMCFIMIIPNVLNKMTELLPTLFAIFKRTLMLKHSSQREKQHHELKVVLFTFLNHLYGLYPYNTIAHIKYELKHDEAFKEKLLPLLKSSKLPTLLVEGDIDSELSDTRWKGIDPGHFILDFIPDLKNFSTVTVEPPSSLSSEVADIITLQHSIEKRLYKPNHQEVIDFSDFPEERTDLLNKIFVLKNQLLFERYIRKQLQERVSYSKKNMIQLDHLELENSTLKYNLSTLEKSLKTIEVKWREEKENVTEAKEKNRKLHQNFSVELNNLRAEMAKLKNDNEALESEKALLKEEIECLKERINESDEELLSLKSQSKYNVPTEALMYIKRFSNIKEELAVWKEHEKLVSMNREDIEYLKEEIDKYNQSTQQLKSTIKAVDIRNEGLTKKYEECKSIIKSLQEENKILRISAENLKGQLETTNTVNQKKLETLNQKYLTIKNISMSFEKEIMRLNST